jgi:hypothetical protein
MDTLKHRFKDKINGVITGFDRIVFKGMLRPIMFAVGMQSFLYHQDVLNKDFKAYVMNQSKKIVESAEEISKRLCGVSTIYIPSCYERKETLAHARQKETCISEGLIGVWSCVESCHTFKSTFNPESAYPILRHEQSKCKHLYYYFDDPVFGFMSIRLQTWAPYEIQIALNGREWLRRSLDANSCKYVLSGNKFLHIDDYKLAQELLDKQLDVDFSKVLNGFLPSVFPQMQQIVPGMSYYWTLWQSEVAKDYIFKDRESLDPLMDDFLRYAMITGTGERILKYFGKPVDEKGQPHPKSNPEVFSRAKSWYDGHRARHWDGKNSVKLYNEHNVLRFEMTMNDPGVYKIHRHSEGQDKTEPKKFMSIRKGIADINVRTEVSKNILNRFTEHMSAVEETERLGKLLEPISKPLTENGKKFRALDAFGKDLEFLQAVSDPAFDVVGITNKGLQEKLMGAAWAKGMSGKRLSGRISRHLALLRKHGLIKKHANQNRYSLTDKGRKITVAVNVALEASVCSLLENAA